jgi:hypothetical protein
VRTDRQWSPPSTDPQAPGKPVDFDKVAGTDAASWERGEPETALIESTGRQGYRVTLPNGDAHLVAVAVDDGQHVGQCACEAWEYHDAPCAPSARSGRLPSSARRMCRVSGSVSPSSTSTPTRRESALSPMVATLIERGKPTRRAVDDNARMQCVNYRYSDCCLASETRYERLQ